MAVTDTEWALFGAYNFHQKCRMFPTFPDTDWGLYVAQVLSTPDSSGYRMGFNAKS
jgi:hypothetical protein